MNSPKPTINVQHDVAGQAFHATIEGLYCSADYRRHGNVVDIVHTGVPPQLEGRGIAAQLVAVALDWARAEGCKVRPSCSYVASYMRRRPETQDLLA